MSFAAKSDFSGLARTGLEIVANSNGATNQVLEIPSSNGDIIANEVFGHVKAPHVEFKITGSVSFSGSNKLTLGKVHGSTGMPSNAGPYALKAVHASSGAGEEPSFSADLVQIEEGANKTVCTYDLSISSVSAARHAITYGAITFTESASLTLQRVDYAGECDIDPTTINGEPRASDAVKGRETVTVTMWTNSDTTAPTVTASDGWVQTADWACNGSDGAMFVWTATFTHYLTASEA